MAGEDVDFAIAVGCEEGLWQVVELDKRVGDDIDDFLDALSGLQSEVGVLGFASVSDEFFVIARVTGDDIRLLLSDVTAMTDWPLASGVGDVLDVPDPDDDDDRQPAGAMDVLSDLGMPAIELAVLCDDHDLYPDEVIGDIAKRLGFGEDFEAVIG